VQAEGVQTTGQTTGATSFVLSEKRGMHASSGIRHQVKHAVPADRLEQSLNAGAPAEETVSLLAFTKHPTYSAKERNGKKPDRIGVPGSKTFNYSSVWSTLSMKGTCFQAIFKSSMFYIHCLLFAIFTVVHWEFDSPNLRGASVPPWVASSVQTVTVFCVVFFTTRVYSRFNERFHDVCRTNGGVTVVSCLTTGYLSETAETRAQAVSLCRYTVAILHVYYMLITGGMDKPKWAKLTAKGILTVEETRMLGKSKAPGVVLYSWCARILKAAIKSGDLTDNEATRIEENISTVRGLAAKQIAYTITQIPLVYFSFITFIVHLFLVVSR
jgi:predicted membrane chloride channel (bestrophin family)